MARIRHDVEPVRYAGYARDSCVAQAAKLVYSKSNWLMVTAGKSAAEKAELEAVLRTGVFDRSPALAQILSYVCGKYFQGAAGEIKEYNIAVEALGHPPDFDQKRDSIVRVQFH